MIALYARVSTTEQAQNGYSIAEQQDRLKSYCQAMDWKSYKVYVDPGFSGASMVRPALQRLIQDVENGKVEKVIVWKLDRLSRSQKDTLYLIEDVFLANKTDFVSMNENFDTSTPFGRAMIGILAVFAQLEREQIKERMSMGKDARAKEGKWHGGVKNPVGYDYIDGNLVINEYYAMQVRELFELYASGLGATAISNLFHSKGYTMPSGLNWNPSQIRRTLRRKVYMGLIDHKGQIYQGTHEPIVSESLFNEVNDLLENRKTDYCAKRTTPDATQYSSCLSGLICCAQCGNKYNKNYAVAQGHKYTYYSCRSRMAKSKGYVMPKCRNKNWKMDELDQLVFNRVINLKLDEIEEKEKKKNLVPVLDKRIKEIDAQISRFLDLYGKGNFAIEQLDEKVRVLQSEKEKLSSQITAQIASNRLSIKEVNKIIESFPSVLKRGDTAEIRNVLYSIIDRIVIDNDNVDIYWRF